MANWTEPKTDWTTNPKPPEATDFNRIENNTQHIMEQIEAKKGAIVEAINDKGVDADIEDTHAELGDKIRNVIDSIETEVSFNIPSSDSTGTTTRTLYINKPQSNAKFFMVIDLLADEFYRSMSICNLQTFKWNTFATATGPTERYIYGVERNSAYIRNGYPTLLGLKDIDLTVSDFENQYRLEFQINWRGYVGETDFIIPIKIFGKVE